MADGKANALERSLEYGIWEDHKWREETFFAPLPSLAEQLAASFCQVAGRHGNTAGNTWLRRHASGLAEPTRVYARFPTIANDLKRAFHSLVTRAPSTIEGLKTACQWLAGVERRLAFNGFNCTYDDDALVNHAEAQAAAVERERNELIGSIDEHNRRLRLGLLPPPLKLPALRGDTLSAQARALAQVIAEARNPLTPPPGGIPLMAVFRWQRAPVLSLSVIDELVVRKARARAASHGITPPTDNWPASLQIARLSCSLWWRRKLRRMAGRRLEQVQREAHRVHAQAGIYCSNMTIERRQQQKVRNRALLETLEAINQEGQTYTLAELAELGLANPDHRRAELMLRIRDTETEARRLGHVGMFYTVTTPSRCHPVIANKVWDAKRKRYRHNCRRNPKYDGSTPREAQQHIQQLWAKTRAKLHRDGVGIYGLRVVEPHHDGTPHWHLLVWMAPEDEPAVTAALQEYAEEEAPEELIDRRGRKTDARFKAVKIDYTRGTAAGYVAKYISKNINGEQFARDSVTNDHQDRYQHDLSDVAPRIEAWAAVWGIRQFQFVGLPSVTVWREMRRLTEKQQQHVENWEAATRPAPTVSERFHLIRQAANAGQWDLFLRLMGGPNQPRKDRPVRPWIETRLDPKRDARDEFSHATGEVAQGITVHGRYGEPLQVTYGLVVTDGRGRETGYLTRVYRWEVRSKPRSPAAGSQGGDEVGAPWTCVTNCTGVDIEPRQPSEEEQQEQRQRFQEWRSSEQVRAEAESAEEEGELARNAALHLIRHDAAARKVLAERGVFIQPPPVEPTWEEFFTPELC